VVHCLAVGSPGRCDHPYQRRGVGSGMVRALIDWARARGWAAIEAGAYEDLPLIYAVTGAAGRSFWEKLGFRVVATSVEPALLGEGDFAAALRREAQAHGLDPDRIGNRYTMRRELA
jgi:ribosomal protein S18 acetylase RimI-like enzyme